MQEIFPKNVTLTPFDDVNAWREDIYDQTLLGLQETFPKTYGGVTLELANLHMPDRKHPTVDEEQNALKMRKFLSTPIKADVILKDAETGQILDEKKNTTVLRVPVLTRRGTITHNGSNYTTIKQARLMPGVYTRVRQNGELETMFASEVGGTPPFRIVMEPSTAKFHLEMKKSKVNLISVLKDFGYSDEQLKQSWGEEIFNINKPLYSSKDIDKLYAKLVPEYKRTATTREEKIKATKEIFFNAKLDKTILENNLPAL